jgi:hypothetical protein
MTRYEGKRNRKWRERSKVTKEWKEKKIIKKQWEKEVRNNEDRKETEELKKGEKERTKKGNKEMEDRKKPSLSSFASPF